MCEPTVSVWFVCRLCRGSFGQVDAFIEHKKQKHFNQFQNTTSIVFEEREFGKRCPVVVKAENQLADESSEPPIKIEGNDEDPIIPISSEIIDEQNVCLVEPKSELITYESEIIPDNENSFFGLNQNSEAPSLSSDYVDSNISDKFKVEKATETQSSSSVRNISGEDDPQFECRLCSKPLESDAKLKIHVGICALYHEDRNRFCVICNRKFSLPQKLKEHRLRFHGTEEERLSLYKFRCHLCPKQYQAARELTFHLDSHKTKKQITTSKLKPFKCSRPNCGKEFECNSHLQRHIAAVHLGVRPVSCSFPNCNKTFSHRGNLNTHFLTHTGERPFKCTVDNCDKAFRTCNVRSRHHRTVHCNL